jgi:hypothetical protein
MSVDYMIFAVFPEKITQPQNIFKETASMRSRGGIYFPLSICYLFLVKTTYRVMFKKIKLHPAPVQIAHYGTQQ